MTEKNALEPVAWHVYNGWVFVDSFRNPELADDYRRHAQTRADLSGNLMAYRIEPLVRQSDAAAIIAELEAELKLAWETNTEVILRAQLAAMTAELDDAKGVSNSAWEQSRLKGIRIAELEAALRLCLHAVELAGWSDDFCAHQARAALQSAPTPDPRDARIKELKK